MKLFTKNQVVFYSALTGIATAAVFSAAFVLAKGKFTKTDTEQTSYNSAIENSVSANAKEEQPVL